MRSCRARSTSTSPVSVSVPISGMHGRSTSLPQACRRRGTQAASVAGTARQWHDNEERQRDDTDKRSHNVRMCTRTLHAAVLAVRPARHRPALPGPNRDHPDMCTCLTHSAQGQHAHTATRDRLASGTPGISSAPLSQQRERTTGRRPTPTGPIPPRVPHAVSPQRWHGVVRDT